MRAAVVLAVGALVALSLAGVAGLGAGAFQPSTPATTPGTQLAGVIATPSFAQQESMARRRLAVNQRAPHPGRPEAVTHPGADYLGSSFPGRRTSGATVGRAAAATAMIATTTTTLPGGSTTTSTSTSTSTTLTSTTLASTTTVPPPPEPIGVDVSSHQGNVNWSAVVAAGDTFAWVKATEGTYYTDSAYFPQQYNGSYDAGMIRGAYHFAIPNNSTGAAQADYFVANGGGWSPDGKTLPGMLDFEYNPYGAECYGMNPAQLVAWVQSFDNEYHFLTGRYPALYTNANFWNTCTGGSSIAAVDPLDLAAWGPSPTPVPGGWSGATVWQYTDYNSLGYDGDMFLGSSANLETFALDPGVTLPTTTTTTTVPCTAAACATTTLPDPTTTVAPTTTTTVPSRPPPPPNALAAGEALAPSHAIVARNGRFEVIMQR
ncbi:MAG: lysozyme, partial [Acidimicrobiales bacterium]